MSSPISRIAPQELTDEVLDRIRTAIITGDLEEGVRLNQEELAERLGVSRSPVRSAISRLLAQGIIGRLPTGGVAVRALDIDDVRAAYEVRVALESFSIQQLINQPTQGALQLERVLIRHQEAIHKYSTLDLMRADREFHTALLDATGNRYFAGAMQTVWPVVERAIWKVLQRRESQLGAWEEHEAIVRAILDGDKEKAPKLLAGHLARGQTRIEIALGGRDQLTTDGTV